MYWPDLYWPDQTRFLFRQRRLGQFYRSTLLLRKLGKSMSSWDCRRLLGFWTWRKSTPEWHFVGVAQILTLSNDGPVFVLGSIKTLQNSNIHHPHSVWAYTNSNCSSEHGLTFPEKSPLVIVDNAPAHTCSRNKIGGAFPEREGEAEIWRGKS